jgi:hypothetical protein
MTSGIPLDPKIRIIIDHVGDPYIWLNIDLPMEAALSAEQLEQLALKMIAAAAAARMRATLARKQMLAGVPPTEAIAFTRDLMDE